LADANGAILTIRYRQLSRTRFISELGGEWPVIDTMLVVLVVFDEVAILSGRNVC